MTPRQLEWGSKSSKEFLSSSSSAKAKGGAKEASKKELKPTKLKPEVLSGLDRELSDRSYFHGYEFSQVDVAVRDNLNGSVPSSYVHLSRWKRNVDSLVESGAKPAKVDKERSKEIRQSLGQSSLLSSVCPCSPGT